MAKKKVSRKASNSNSSSSVYSKRYVRYLINYDVGGGGNERVGFKTLSLDEMEAEAVKEIVEKRIAVQGRREQEGKVVFVIS